jgi:hypothetical protein
VCDRALRRERDDLDIASIVITHAVDVRAYGLGAHAIGNQNDHLFSFLY